jgi:2-iminobutanoate/2-iminopropanoate deaminase
MHYNQAIVDGDDVSLSGQVGWDEHYEIAGEDVVSQAEQAFDNIETLLAEMGRDLSEVKKVTTHLLDPPERLEAYQAVYNDVFDAEPYPCHTILGVESLAMEDFLIEIEIEL